MIKTIVRDEVDIVFNSSQFPSSIDLTGKYGLGKECEDGHFQLALPTQEPNHSLTSDSQTCKILQTKLERKNREIERLCVMLEALEPMPGINPSKYKSMIDGDIDDSVDFRDSKIVALAKKSHKLTMLLNKERCGNEDLRNQINGYINELELAKQLGVASAVNIIESKGYSRHLKLPDESVDDGVKIISLYKELREMAKLCEDLKRKNASQNDENKNLTKALMRELGDGVSLEQAVDGGWRGRAQQIIMLKSKVKKLEKVLNDSNGEASSSSKATNVDSRALEDIAGMSNVRRRIVDALTEERVSLTDANQNLEKKYNAQKARIGTLENEIKKLKENFQVVLDKSVTDDELLDLLRGEIDKLKYQIRSNNSLIIAASSKTVDKLTENRDSELTLQSEISRLQRLCKNQAEQIDSQDQTIRLLKKRQG